MSIDYKQVVKVLAEEVEHAKAMKCSMPDPYGITKEYSIKDISFHIIGYNSVSYLFENSFIDEVSPDINATLLIKIWIGNEHKEIQSCYAYDELSINPECLKIFIRSEMFDWIRMAVIQYFKQDTEFVKYSRKSNDPVEVSIAHVSDFQDSLTEMNVVQHLESFSREIYKIPGVLYISMALNKRRLVNIVVDSDGRQILESKTNLMISSCIEYLNQQSYKLNLTDSFYYNNEKDLVNKLSSIKSRLVARIASHQNLGFLDAAKYPILFDHSSVHTLFHEGLAGHLLSGDYVVNEESTYFQNHQATDLSDVSEDYDILKQLTILVDPTNAKAFGGYEFDQEGIRGQKTILCNKGVLSNFLLSRNSAARLNTLSNGHARAENYVDERLVAMGAATTVMPVAILPEARISHLIINSSNGLADAELFKTITKHVSASRRPLNYYLFVSAQSGAVDVSSGLFTLYFDSCQKIYFDGRVETINGGSISGSPHELLASIKAVGCKNYYEAGYCGSTSGWVPISSVAPQMYLTAHYVPNPKPKERKFYSAGRDKYIPESFK